MEEIVKQGKIMVACETVTPAATNNVRENKPAVSKPKETEIRPVEEFNSDSELTLDMVKKKWKDILETFKARRHMVLYASLITGRLSGCNKGVIEIFYEPQYSFNKQRMEKEDNRRVSEEIFSEVLNEKIKLKYVVEKKKEQDISPEERLIQTFGEDFVEIIDE